MPVETNLLRVAGIGYKIDESAFKQLLNELRKTGRIIASPNMQLHRAKRFTEYTKRAVRTNDLNLKKISEATKIIQGGSPHPPLYWKGGLINEMGVRPVGKNAADAGYFEDSPLIPGKKITWTQAAVLHHTGYRIPLFGDKGRRVRRWLAAQGIFKDLPAGGKPKGSSRWLIVPARPFLFTSYYSYLSEGKDMQAVDEFLNKVMNSPIDETMKRGKQ